MEKGFELRRAARRTGRFVAAGRRGPEARAGFVLLPPKEGEGMNRAAGYLTPLRQALCQVIDNSDLSAPFILQSLH